MIKRSLLVLLLGAGILHGEETARQALRDGLPQVAVYKLRQALEKSSPEKREELVMLLAEALIRTGRGNEAVAVLREESGIQNEDELKGEMAYWMAEALATERDYAGAEKFYRRALASGDAPWKDAAVIGLARALAVEGRLIEAREALAGLPENSSLRAEADRLAAQISLLVDDAQAMARLQNPSEKALTLYLEAQAALAGGDAAGAAKKLHEVLASVRSDSPLAVAAAAALLSADPEAGVRETENLLRSRQRPRREEMLWDLLEAHVKKGRETSLGKIQTWARDPSDPYHAPAVVLDALLEARNGSPENASHRLQELLQRGDIENSVRVRAALILAEISLREGHPRHALLVLKDNWTAIEASRRVGEGWYLRGLAENDMGMLADAVASFRRASDVSAALAKPVLYNLALLEARQGAPASARAILPSGTDEFLERQLEFEIASEMARRGARGSEKRLRELMKPGIPLSDKAAVALAEMGYFSNNPRAYEDGLRFIANEKASPEAQEQMDFLKIFEVDRDMSLTDEQRAQIVKEFLLKHPKSSHAPEARMKLGQIQYERGYYPAAAALFLRVVSESRDASLRMHAQLLAARALARSMNTEALAQSVALLDELAAQGHPEIAQEARIEQANAKLALGVPEEAIVILDNLLGQKLKPATRARVLLKKGDIYMSELARPAESAAAYSEVSTMEDASDAQRVEALAKLGLALQQAGDNDGALAAFYDALNFPSADTEPEWFWRTRAGFDAAEMLENGGQLREALAVYQKIASLGGPRAAEADARMNRLRLENFVWEEEGRHESDTR